MEIEPRESAEAAAVRAARGVGLDVRVARHATRLEHTITRYRITIDAFDATPDRARPATRARRSEGEGKARRAWVTPSALEDRAMPAPHRKLARLLTEDA